MTHVQAEVGLPDWSLGFGHGVLLCGLSALPSIGLPAARRPRYTFQYAPRAAMCTFRSAPTGAELQFQLLAGRGDLIES